MIEALSNPDRYDQLSARFAQSPLRLDHVFKKDSSSDTCGTQSVCPAYEGKTEKINGRKYNLYCINAPWGSYFWLPAAKSLEECEANCHKNSYDCNVSQSFCSLLPVKPVYTSFSAILLGLPSLHYPAYNNNERTDMPTNPRA